MYVFSVGIEVVTLSEAKGLAAGHGTSRIRARMPGAKPGDPSRRNFIAPLPPVFGAP